jgi:hypothetical protein
MAHTFSDDENDDLIERGFDAEQIHYLETLEMVPEELYSDICKIMDDFGDTPEQIIESYQDQDAQNNPPEQNNEVSSPSQGGKRRKQNKTRRRTKRRTKSKSKNKTRRRTKSKSKRRK